MASTASVMESNYVWSPLSTYTSYRHIRHMQAVQVFFLLCSWCNTNKTLKKDAFRRETAKSVWNHSRNVRAIFTWLQSAQHHKCKLYFVTCLVYRLSSRNPSINFKENMLLYLYFFYLFIYLHLYLDICIFIYLLFYKIWSFKF